VLAAAVPPAIGTVAVLVAASASWRGAAVAAAWLAGAVGGHVVWSWLPPKKELVLTPRMRRLLATAAAGSALVAGMVALAIEAAHAASEVEAEGTLALDYAEGPAAGLSSSVRLIDATLSQPE